MYIFVMAMEMRKNFRNVSKCTKTCYSVYGRMCAGGRVATNLAGFCLFFVCALICMSRACARLSIYRAVVVCVILSRAAQYKSHYNRSRVCVHDFCVCARADKFHASPGHA